MVKIGVIAVILGAAGVGLCRFLAVAVMPQKHDIRQLQFPGL